MTDQQCSEAAATAADLLAAILAPPATAASPVAPASLNPASIDRLPSRRPPDRATYELHRRRGYRLVRSSYPPQAYRRLVEVKNAVDPTNLFRLNQNIVPTT